MLLALGLVLFVSLIILHEFGHYLAARMSGVKVEEFGIGFPPRIRGRRFKKGGTLYSLNWLPLGGFVRLKGEHDADKTKGSYGAARLGAKSFILMAGVLMNLLAAVVILTVLSATGLPKLVDNQFAVASDTQVIQNDVLVTYLVDNSPAARAGLEVGDAIVSLNGQTLDSSETLAPLAEEHAGQTVGITWSSAGQETSGQVTLNSQGGDDGYLGVSTGDFVVERSTWSAPIRGVGLTLQFTWLTIKGVATTVGELLIGQGSAAADNVAGPVGIVVLLNDIAQAGLSFVMMFLALISVTLAVMNALPIPALDGGRLFVTYLFRLIKKPLSTGLEERIQATGMALLIGLVILITFVDVNRL